MFRPRDPALSPLITPAGPPISDPAEPAKGGPLGHRARKILFAVITEFVATGEPVGSRTLARKYGLDLSAASIRNVLADLEEGGFLAQPHTSAGRIPTDRALRLFVDALGGVRPLEPEEQAALQSRFRDICADAAEPLRETGRYLSELAGTAAIVGPPKTELRALSQVRFIRTRPSQMLAVLVFADGSVENRFVAAPEIPEPELIRIHNLLDDVIEGRSLSEVRELFARRLEGERKDLDTLRRKAFELGRSATEATPVGGTSARKDDLVIEGQTRLLALPEYAGDVQRLRRLVQALEEREELLELLDRTLSSGAVTVFVGSEARGVGDGELSLVVAPYAEGGRVAGTVGILGPTRMDYAKAVSLVDATAQALGEALTKKQ
jgi:heat-inducible transcriptional repressor